MSYPTEVEEAIIRNVEKMKKIYKTWLI